MNIGLFMASNSKTTWRMLLKSGRIRTTYYLRLIYRTLPDKLSFSLFIVATILFMVVVSPKILDRLMEAAMLASGTQTLQVSGYVFEQARCPNGTVHSRPIEGAVIEIGGFNTSSNSVGFYKLKFRSQTTMSIPIICRQAGRQIVERFSFPEGKRSAEKELTFQ
jgi:hypothetical protein